MRRTPSTESPHPKALRAGPPATLEPQLLCAKTEAPNDAENWLTEIKYDGYRLLVRIDGDDIRLITRNGHNWTNRLRPLANKIRLLDWPNGWYDGEMVAFSESGKPSFDALQEQLARNEADDLAYIVFDCPYLAGYDLRNVPLELRRAYLRNVHPHDTKYVRFSTDLHGSPHVILEQACALGLEGITCKRRDSAYRSDRLPTWLKIKCFTKGAFTIVGYEPGRTGLRSLLLAREQAGALRYAGSVKTGFTDKMRQELQQALETIQTSAPTCTGLRSSKLANWIQPVLQARVRYLEIDKRGRLRHAAFKGLYKS